MLLGCLAAEVSESDCVQTVYIYILYIIGLLYIYIHTHIYNYIYIWVYEGERMEDTGCIEISFVLFRALFFRRLMGFWKIIAIRWSFITMIRYASRNNLLGAWDPVITATPLKPNIPLETRGSKIFAFSPFLSGSIASIHSRARYQLLRPILFLVQDTQRNTSMNMNISNSWDDWLALAMVIFNRRLYVLMTPLVPQALNQALVGISKPGGTTASGADTQHAVMFWDGVLPNSYSQQVCTQNISKYIIQAFLYWGCHVIINVFYECLSFDFLN